MVILAPDRKTLHPRKSEWWPVRPASGPELWWGDYSFHEPSPAKAAPVATLRGLDVEHIFHCDQFREPRISVQQFARYDFALRLFVQAVGRDPRHVELHHHGGKLVAVTFDHNRAGADLLQPTKCMRIAFSFIAIYSESLFSRTNNGEIHDI